MKSPVKLLTTDCCNELLRFTADTELRECYNSGKPPVARLKYLSSTAQYSIDTNIRLGVRPKDDLSNSKIIFSELKDLDLVQANDKRLWVLLTHSLFFDYVRLRWSIGENSSNETITSRFHFEGSGIESRMRNAIARLWWSAKISYDEDRRNPFELTELLWEKQDILTSLVERSLGTYQGVLHGFLEFYGKNKHLKEKDIRELAKGINALGGVRILPLLDKKDVITELKGLARFNRIKIG